MLANLLWFKATLRFGAGIEALIDGEYEKLADMVIWSELPRGAMLCTSYFSGSEVIKRPRIFWHCPSTFGKYVGSFTSCVRLLSSANSSTYKPSREV